MSSESADRLVRTIIEEPREGNPGHAGVGISHDPAARRAEMVRVEQLWPSGSAEPVYVHEDKVLELAAGLISLYDSEVRDVE